MPFQTMDPAVVRALLATETDIITPAAKVEAELYKLCQCPLCGHQGADKVTLPPKMVHDEQGAHALRLPFSNASSLVVGHAKCPTCQTEYSPRTGVIIKSGVPTSIEAPENY